MPIENQEIRLQPTAPPQYGDFPQNGNIDSNKNAPPPSYKELFG